MFSYYNNYMSIVILMRRRHLDNMTFIVFPKRVTHSKLCSITHVATKVHVIFRS